MRYFNKYDYVHTLNVPHLIPNEMMHLYLVWPPKVKILLVLMLESIKQQLQYYFNIYLPLMSGKWFYTWLIKTRSIS